MLACAIFNAGHADTSIEPNDGPQGFTEEYDKKLFDCVGGERDEDYWTVDLNKMIVRKEGQEQPLATEQWLRTGTAATTAGTSTFTSSTTTASQTSTKMAAGLSAAYGPAAASVAVARDKSVKVDTNKKSIKMGFGSRTERRLSVKHGASSEDGARIGEALIMCTPNHSMRELIATTKDYSNFTARAKAIRTFYQLFGINFVSAVVQARYGTALGLLTQDGESRSERTLISMQAKGKIGTVSGEANFSNDSSKKVSSNEYKMTCKGFVKPADPELSKSVDDAISGWMSAFKDMSNKPLSTISSNFSSVTMAPLRPDEVTIDESTMKKYKNERNDLDAAELACRYWNEQTQTKDINGWLETPATCLTHKSQLEDVLALAAPVLDIDLKVAQKLHWKERVYRGNARSYSKAIQNALTSAELADGKTEAQKARAKELADDASAEVAAALKRKEEVLDWMDKKKIAEEELKAFTAWLTVNDARFRNGIDFDKVSLETVKSAHLAWKAATKKIVEYAEGPGGEGCLLQGGYDDLFSLMRADAPGQSDITTVLGDIYTPDVRMNADTGKTSDIYEQWTTVGYEVTPWSKIFPSLELKAVDDSLALIAGEVAQQLIRGRRDILYLHFLQKYGPEGSFLDWLNNLYSKEGAGIEKKGILNRQTTGCYNLLMGILAGSDSANVMGTNYRIYDNAQKEVNWDDIRAAIRTLNDAAANATEDYSALTKIQAMIRTSEGKNGYAMIMRHRGNGTSSWSLMTHIAKTKTFGYYCYHLVFAPLNFNAEDARFGFNDPKMYHAIGEVLYELKAKNELVNLPSVMPVLSSYYSPVHVTYRKGVARLMMCDAEGHTMTYPNDVNTNVSVMQAVSNGCVSNPSLRVNRMLKPCETCRKWNTIMKHDGLKWEIEEDRLDYAAYHSVNCKDRWYDDYPDPSYSEYEVLLIPWAPAVTASHNSYIGGLTKVKVMDPYEGLRLYPINEVIENCVDELIDRNE